MTNKKQIIINCEELETRLAFLKNGRLEEYEIERASEEIVPGSIYLGKIVRLEPSLEAAFVDIGAEKNAFLHYRDMLPVTHDIVENIKRLEKGDSAEEKPVKKSGKKSLFSGFADKIRNFIGGDRSRRLRDLEVALHHGKITVQDIPKMFPAGSELLVQVTKGPIGTKGARVTTNLTIPGRYLVLLPYSEHIGLSSRIEEKKERDRLRRILRDLELPDGMGLICRTVGEGRKALFFKRDLDMLLSLWCKVEAALEKPQAPLLVHKEPTLLERTIRDFLTDEIDEIVIDSKEKCDFLKETFHQFVGNDFDTKVVYYNKAEPIFSKYKIGEQVAGIFERIVPLPGGGYLCIDETEALVAIDINSGKSRAKDQADNILQTNLEAAEEIARQMRLRNIGGQIVIDFIDMRSSADRETINRAMKKFVCEDRAKTRVLPLSKFGLMEMTRQREHESINDTVYDPCPYCNGSGHVKSAISMSVEIQRRLKALLKRRQHSRNLAIRVIMHPAILARLKNKDAELLENLEDEYGKDLSFRADPSIHIEEYKLINPETGEEYQV